MSQFKEHSFFSENSANQQKKLADSPEAIPFLNDRSVSCDCINTYLLIV